MSLNCSLHTRFNTLTFIIHGTEPINWIYQVRERVDMYIKQHGDKLDAREIDFLEDGLLPVVDQYITLCRQIDEERELEEQAQLDQQYELHATAN